ncbi:11882_t:CDS:2 [Entrophospora sp. SA101]|nr:11882_t:CDS:2 [Entrophospora sp. SA101]
MGVPKKAKLSKKAKKGSDDDSYQEETNDNKKKVKKLKKDNNDAEKDVKPEQKKLSQKSSLRRHTKSIHFGIKGFKCEHPGCTKSFGQKVELQDHTRRHLGLKNLECDVVECAKKFVTGGDLRRHKSRMHQNPAT